MVNIVKYGDVDCKNRHFTSSHYMELPHKQQSNQTAEQSFMQAFDAYSDEIFRYSMFKLSDRELALDFMQETFAKFWTYIQKDHEALSNTRAFLYKIASHMIIDEYRRRGKRGKSHSLDTLMEDGFDAGEIDRTQTEDHLMIQEAIDLIQKLPAPYGETIFLRYVQDMQVKEISKYLKESENVISVRIHRGIEKMKAMMKARNEKNEKDKENEE